MIEIIVGTIIIMKGHCILGSIVLLEGICGVILAFEKK
jgi:hypothetical protein